MDKSRRWLDPEMQPRYPDGTLVNPDYPWGNPDNPWILRMPIPRGICNATTLQWKVELLEHPLRSYSPKVNRRCLFAVDVQMDCPTSGFFFPTQQQEGLKCPCCRRTQQQCYTWRGINFGGPSEIVGTANQESITLELEPPQSQSQPQLHAYSGDSHPGKWWSCCKRKKD